MRKRNAAFASAALLTLPLLSVLPSAPVSATDVGSVTQITNGNNKSTVPAITGAGDRIAFHSVATNLGGATGQGTTDDLYLATGTAISPLVTDGFFPDISANGAWIVYTEAPAGIYQVKRYNVATGAIATVTSGNADSGSNPQFNVAGARVDNNGNVVFQSKANNLGPADADANWDIYYWNGSSTNKLSDDSQPNFVLPDISADGSTIAYHSTGGVSADLYKATPAGGQQVIAAGDGNDEFAHVNDNGSKIVFRSDSVTLAPASPNTANVYVWTSGGIARVTSYGDGVAVTNPAISGDGAFVAFARGNQIYRSVAAAAGTTITLSDHQGTSTFINFPTLNVDGTKIAFGQSTNNTVAGVQVMLWTTARRPRSPSTAASAHPNADLRSAGHQRRQRSAVAPLPGLLPASAGRPRLRFWQQKVAQGNDLALDLQLLRRVGRVQRNLRHAVQRPVRRPDLQERPVPRLRSRGPGLLARATRQRSEEPWPTDARVLELPRVPGQDVDLVPALIRGLGNHLEPRAVRPSQRV